MFTETRSRVMDFTPEVRGVYNRDMIQLSKAVICVDCDAISETIMVCPGCGSRQLLSLARVLNRTNS